MPFWATKFVLSINQFPSPSPPHNRLKPFHSKRAKKPRMQHKNYVTYVSKDCPGEPGTGNVANQKYVSIGF